MRAVVAAVSIGILPLFAGCVDDATSEGADVLASFYPLAFVAERVAGDRLVVASLVPGGVEPHEWEPTAETVIAVGEAKVLLRNGAGLDSWIDRVVKESGTRALVIDASAGLPLLERGDAHDEEGGEGEAGEASRFDPHYWLDPALIENVTRTVAEALARADPEGAATFRANAGSLARDLRALDGEFQRGLATCSQREILATHVAFSYPAQRYGFTQHGITGISPDEEPSPARIREVVDFARSRNITTVFHERLVSPRLAVTVAMELGGATLPLDPIEGIPRKDRDAGKDYFSLQRENLANLRLGMGCA